MKKIRLLRTIASYKTKEDQENNRNVLTPYINPGTEVVCLLEDEHSIKIQYMGKEFWCPKFDMSNLDLNFEYI